ncbi:4-hydroxy-tetrahydrodipicolinate synthase [Luteimicrobium xylanilyticum]|uniref:4-hydroxy-tetrahydrodipicolinate synthase n=1 Tax=Luteimicrobium xylanilyticum TaxID=1133546 RepID=A0A5P9Q9J6_9MICO|nr:dihydrodipicolinate synthase family protein [Luteimicrobium xylanilyticum]QFU97810.1 4-hydroxy-tetrahydrodipicolinate synthase [Luteimicrobium xylanilyticum]
MTLTGVLVPLVTPFDRGGAVALGALESLAHQVLDDGAAGLVALGTTAEPSSLSAVERQAVLDVVGRVATERRTTLLVGASTAEDLAALRGRTGVTAALTLVPPFVRPGEDGAVAHLATLARLSPVPLVVYHVPHRTSQDLGSAALHRLARVDGIVGTKLSIPADGSAVALLGDLPDDFDVLAGDDTVLAPMLALGASGGVLASAHLATAAYARLVDAWAAPRVDTADARALGARLAGLSAACFAEPNPVVVKGVLHAQGRIPTAAVRLPLLPASTASVDAALASLDAVERAVAQA